MQELIDAELTSKDRPLDIEKLPSMSLVSGYFGPAHVSDHIYLVYCIVRRQNQKPQVEICSLTLIFFNEN